MILMPANAALVVLGIQGSTKLQLNGQTTKTETSARVKPLYVAILVIVTLAAIAWAFMQWNNRHSQTDLTNSAKQQAENVASALAGTISRYRQTIANKEHNPLAISSLPGFDSVHTINRSDLADSSMLAKQHGYAALDMLKKAFASATSPAAEMWKPGAKESKIILAWPISKEKPVEQVLLAYISPQFISAAADQVNTGAIINLQLVQGNDSGPVLYEKSQQTKSLELLNIPVTGTIWQLRYAVQKVNAGITTAQYIAAVIALCALAFALVYLRNLPRKEKAKAVTTETEQPQPKQRIAAKPKSEPTYSEVDSTFVPPAKKGDYLVPPEIFREYDIRGIIGEQLDSNSAELIGLAFGSLCVERGIPSVAIAMDTRNSGQEMTNALARGLAQSGCDVVDLGLVPTPVMYFAIEQQVCKAGVMVTASHNPANYNGFKIILDNMPLQGEELTALHQRIEDNNFTNGSSKTWQQDLREEYIKHICSNIKLKRKLKIVVDAANGATGELAPKLFECLGCEVTPLYCDADGDFPNHAPDPSQPENLIALEKAMLAEKADIGFAFDGDGDRTAVVGNLGQAVLPDHTLMLLAGDILQREPGADILYDVKCSSKVATHILANGGSPIMWKPGHTRMKSKMRETNAMLGGEYSGHFFIKERWSGIDDGLYTATRVAEILATSNYDITTLVSQLPPINATPELIAHTDEGSHHAIMRAIIAHANFEDARVVELDGLRVEFSDGWGLVRASNTSPALTFRFEADNDKAMANIQSRFRQLLQPLAPDLALPF